MRESRTVTGKPFSYKGDIGQGLEVRAGRSRIQIPSDVLNFIRTEIKKAGADGIAMGSCRDNPSPGSLGWKLKYEYEPSRSPQLLCYVVPLLVEAQFCKTFISKTARTGKAYFMKAF